MWLLYLNIFCLYIFFSAFEALFPRAAFTYPSTQAQLKRKLLNITYGLVWFSLIYSLNTLEIIQNFKFWSRPFLPFWFVVLFSFFILDFSTYLWHRLNHSISFLRFFHKLHHSDEEVDFTTSLRFHFVELTLQFAFKALIVILFDLPLWMLIVYENLLFVAGLFHHSQIKLTPTFNKILRRVFVTPAYHLTHHSNQLNESNSNYSAILTLWDHLFKTYLPNAPQKVGAPNKKNIT